jgi:hypothetical protein
MRSALGSGTHISNNSLAGRVWFHKEWDVF